MDRTRLDRSGSRVAALVRRIGGRILAGLAVALVAPAAPAQTAAELAEAKWVTGRVELPPDVPEDELVRIVAEGEPFGGGVFHSVELEPDGTFRVAFSKATGRGRLRFSGRFLHHMPRRLTPGNTDRPVVLRPELGARIAGVVVAPDGVDPAELVGTQVVLRVSRRPLEQWGGRVIERRCALGPDLAFLFHGIPAPSEASVAFESAGLLGSAVTEIALGPRADREVRLEPHVGAVVRGRVVDENGAPVARAHVWRGAPSRAVPAGPWTVRTDRDGAFELGRTAPGAFAVSAHRQGLVPARVELEVADGAVLEGVELVLETGGAVEGVVVDPSGRPLPGVWVGLERVERFERDGASADDHLDCVSFGGRSEISSTDERMEHRYTVVRTRTDAAGRFTFLGIDDAFPFDVWLSGGPDDGDPRVTASTGVLPGGAPLRLELAPSELEEAAPPDPIDVTIGNVEPPAAMPRLPAESRPALSGRVSGPDGEPVPGVRVRVTPAEVDAATRGPVAGPSVVTDRDGRYELLVPFAGPARVVARGRGFPVAERVVRLDVGASPALDVELVRAGRVTGRATWADGSPAGGCIVFANAATGEDLVDGRVRRDGSFDLRQLPPGHWVLEVCEARDFDVLLTRVVEVGAGGTVEVELVVERARIPVTGRVSVGGEPLVGGTIELFDLERTGESELAELGPDGSFEVRVRRSAWYAIEVERGGFLVSLARHVPVTEALELDLAIPTGAVEGRFLGPDGERVADALVMAYPWMDVGGVRPVAIVDVRTSDDGSFRFPHLPPDTYRIASGPHVDYMDNVRPGRSDASVSGVVVEAGGVVRGVELVAPRGVRVEGFVLDRYANGVEGATVHGRLGADLLTHEPLAVTDARGGFVVERMAPGTELFATTRHRASMPVVVEGGAVIELVLLPATLLRLHVVDEHGSDGVAGLRVLDEDGRECLERPDVDWLVGFHESAFGPLPPGTYRVEALGLRGGRATREVVVADEAERKLDVRLDP